MIPPRSDKRAFEVYRHGVELANIDGKELEISVRDSGDWYKRLKSNCGDELYWSCNDYRLAPEPARVVPWTFETCPIGIAVMKKDKADKQRVLITEVTDDSVSLDGWYRTFKELLEGWEQLDGSPCGTVEESWPKWFKHTDSNNNFGFGSPIAYITYTSSDDIGTQVLYSGKETHNYNDWDFKVALKHVANGDWKQITRTEAEALLKGAK